ncbi:MAG TPA: PadR family transcriptional regulator [Micromonosporaceae bacterium]
MAGLSDAGFQILLTLADGERHGYEILQALGRAGTSRIGPTTLYRTVRALRESGFIEESDQRRDPTEDDIRRRYYRITALGRQAAQDELQRLRSLIAMADQTTLARRSRPRTAT